MDHSSVASVKLLTGVKSVSRQKETTAVGGSFKQRGGSLTQQEFFKASALWADVFYKLICPYVCLCVCLSVSLSVC